MSVTLGLEQQDDGGLPRFRVRLSTVLALMRVLAGPRGHSRITWWAGGFSYELRVVRQDAIPVATDFDATARHHDQARAALLARLEE